MLGVDTLPPCHIKQLKSVRESFRSVRVQTAKSFPICCHLRLGTRKPSSSGSIHSFPAHTTACFSLAICPFVLPLSDLFIGEDSFQNELAKRGIRTWHITPR